MCGIAGGMMKSGSPPELSILKKMQAALRHRGPDGEGHIVQDATGLVHTRLAIVDVEGGVQPFESDAGVSLVANGEIYNDLELRGEYGDAAYRSKSDNESILHSYLQNDDMFSFDMQGMYAAALYDARTKSLVLARDLFGIKPLYYVEAPGAFWFASEPQVFVAAGLIPPTQHVPARDQLLALQYTCGEDSIFAGVKRVTPGETLVIRNGEVVSRMGISASPSELSSEPSHADDFEAKWLNAVDVHRRSDVPYGVFLSGGTDSAAVLAAMRALEDRPVVAYTVGFSGSTVHDERAQAATVAEAVGADHRCIEVTAKDFWQTLPTIAQTMDDPVADYAVVPTYLLAQTAAKDVKVVLTGEGGDEILGGYGRYRAGRRPWPFRKRPWSRHALAGTGVLRDPGERWRARLFRTEQEAGSRPWSRLQKLQAVDIAHWLPNDLLMKVDRCLMAHGVEGRVPFLDDHFSAYAFGLPDTDKIRGRLGKMSLRRWLNKVLPESQPFARKRGFSVPVGAWMSEKAEDLAPLVSVQAGIGECCEPEAVARLFKSHSPQNAFAAWVLLFYALWHQCHIVGVDCSGSVREVLSHRP